MIKNNKIFIKTLNNQLILLPQKTHTHQEPKNKIILKIFVNKDLQYIIFLSFIS